MEQYNNELFHYGVKGMKWGHRRAQRYEAKARKFRNKAKEYDPDRHGLSEKDRYNTKRKQIKYNDKADRLEIRSRLNGEEGKTDLKKIRAAYKLGGQYTDTKGFVRGPYADAVSGIRAEKGERYAAQLMSKYENQLYSKIGIAASVFSVSVTVGMAYVISKMED